MLNDEVDRLCERLALLEGELQDVHRANRLLCERLDAVLDATGVSLWEAYPQTGALQVLRRNGTGPDGKAAGLGDWRASLHPDDRDQVLTRYRAHLAGETGCYEAEYRVVGQGGAVVWLWDHGKVVERDAAGQAMRVLGVHEDITARKAAEAELARLAHHDPLTGLPNRMTFFHRLERELATCDAACRQLAVLFVDLDNFKQINDRHGHAVGDQVLALVAERLRHLLREGDEVARLGGDEFILLLTGDNICTLVREIADSILLALEQPLCLAAQRFVVGASIGIAMYPFHGRSAEALLLHADSAMYAAKAAGRHRACDDLPGSQSWPRHPA
jgi:diguanylate cyclase (GGDEF)-like protein